MRVYNPISDNHLVPEIQSLLDNYRADKNFNAQQYLSAKAILLNKYMTKCGLKACVVAVSGGIDSAVVLGIVHFASQLANSPIKKILPVCLPVSSSSGATGQDLATKRGTEVCLCYGLQPYVIELSPPHKLIADTVSQSLEIPGQDWAQGQLVAHTRTPTLYYSATLLTQNNLPAIICGTTNRDEGLYLGYFGKASDGLVDLQLISDLHKSEVYKVALVLQTPTSILEVTPQGDMYDGRVDEEVFGAPYSFVEYYLYFLTLTTGQQQSILSNFTKEATEQFHFFAANLENLHNYNRHKYFGASPAVHLDLDYMEIPEGWKTNCSFEHAKENHPVKTNNFVGLFTPDSIPESFTKPLEKPSSTNVLWINKNDSLAGVNSTIPAFDHSAASSLESGLKPQPVYVIEGALSDNEIQWFLKQTKKATFKPANQYGKQDSNTAHVMSQRASIFQEHLAAILFQRIRRHIPALKISNGDRIYDSKDVWVATGINPLLRYIQYQSGQHLVAHYDDTYQASEYKKTLMSVIIYLNNSTSCTRFIVDPQNAIKEPLRDYSDWHTLGSNIELSIPAKAGQIIVFDHRILHDATEPTEEKNIIRTDIFFESPQFGFKL